MRRTTGGALSALKRACYERQRSHFNKETSLFQDQSIFERDKRMDKRMDKSRRYRNEDRTLRYNIRCWGEVPSPQLIFIPKTPHSRAFFSSFPSLPTLRQLNTNSVPTMVFSDLRSRLKAVFSLTVRPRPCPSSTNESKIAQSTNEVGPKGKKPKRTLKLKLPWIKRKVPVEGSRTEHFSDTPSERQPTSVVAALLEDRVLELTESVRRVQDAVGAIHDHRQQRLQAGFHYLDLTDTVTDTLSDSFFLTPEHPYRLHYGPHVENIENSCELEFDNEVARILTRYPHCHGSFQSEHEVCNEEVYRCKTRRGRVEDYDWASQLTPSTPRSSSSSLMSPLVLPSAIPAETGPLNETHHISYIPARCETVGGLQMSVEPLTSETPGSPTAPHSIRSSISMSMSFSVKSPALSAQWLSTKVTPSATESNAHRKSHILLKRIESMSGRRKMQTIMNRIRKLELIRTELRQDEQQAKGGSEIQRWQSVQRQHQRYPKGCGKIMGRQLWPRGLGEVEAETDVATTGQPSRRHDIRSPYIYRHTPRVATFQDWLEAHRVEPDFCGSWGDMYNEDNKE